MKIDLDAARELNIWVTNGPLSNTVAVAEHTMMLILACAKKLVFFDRAARRGDYDIRNRVKGMDLEGKTLGLLGLGKIGHMVAKKAINGFGMEVIKYVRDGRIVCFIIVGIEIQDFSGQTVHHVAARSLHDNVTHKVRRKRSSLHQSFMKHLKFRTIRKFTK